MYLFYLTMKTPNGLMALGILVYAIILAILCPVLIKKEKYAVMRILCVLPLAAAVIHYGVYGSLTFSKFRYLYCECLIPLVYLLPGKSKIFGGIKSVVSAAGVLLLCVYHGVNSIGCPMIHNYTRYSYSESFDKMLNTLEKEHCLNSWKRIDYDMLRERYMPAVEEAERNCNEAAYAEIIKEVCYRFYDIHTGAHLNGSLYEQVDDALTGNNYGLSMIRLDDGSVIAICTCPDYEEYGYVSMARKCGIHDGTRILSWDGKDIDEALAEIECIAKKFPVVENEEVFKPICLAGKGGESVDITFINDDGEVQSASLSDEGIYEIDYYVTASSLLYHWNSDTKNFSSRMLDDKCGYLRISVEHYDSLKDNIAAARGGYYPELTEYYAEIIKGLIDQGMEYLVIDIRDNGGGYDCIGGALVSLFTDEKRHMVAFGYEYADGYHIKENQYIFPDGRYKDLPVVALTNSECVSAGDGLAKYLADCDNVTLMGVTASSGVNQNNGGYIYLTENITVKYPVFLSLSEDGEPFIDTDYTRTNRIPLEETIPMTKEFALKMFSIEDNYPEKQDPELEYAIAYLEK